MCALNQNRTVLEEQVARLKEGGEQTSHENKPQVESADTVSLKGTVGDVAPAPSS